MKAWAGFDLEIFNTFEQGRPYGISCAGVRTGDRLDTILWHGEDTSRAMTKKECGKLVSDLEAMVDSGYKLVTWNGLQFDFSVLAEESGLHDRCAALAMNHYDMMFQFLAIKGFPVKLDKVCQAMGIAGKLDGMSGAAAPEMWQEGRVDEVLEYLGQDCTMTFDVAQAAQRTKNILWITGSGKRNGANLGTKGLLTVAEAMKLPLPDTSWMDKPIKRESMMEWIDKEAETSVVYFTVGDEHAYDLIGVETVDGKMRLITDSGHSVVIGVNGDNVVLSYLNSEQPFATWSDPVPIGKVTDSAPF